MKRAILLLALLLYACKTTPVPTPRANTHTAVITFDSPTAYTDGTPITADKSILYNLYQSAADGSDSVMIAENFAGPAFSVDSNLPDEGEVCWHVVAIVDGYWSPPSEPACKTFVAEAEQFPPIEMQTVTVNVT